MRAFTACFVASYFVLLFLGGLTAADWRGRAERSEALMRERMDGLFRGSYVVVRYADVYQGGISILEVDEGACEATARAMRIGRGSGRIVADCVKTGGE